MLIFAFLAADLAATALGFDAAGFFVVAVDFSLAAGFALVLTLLRALALVLAALGLAAGFALVLALLRALALVLVALGLAAFFIVAGEVLSLAEDFLAGLRVAADFAAIMTNFTVSQFAQVRCSVRRPAPRPSAVPETGPSVLRRMVNCCRTNKKWAGIPHPSLQLKRIVSQNRL